MGSISLRIPWVPTLSEVANAAVLDEGVPWTQIAELIGRRLSVPGVSKSGKAASKHFGFLSLFAGIDNPVSSQWTQQQLGWEPKQPGLIADLEQGSYFTAI